MLIAVLLVTALICGGCLGGKETDEVTYVICIGIDATDGKEIEVTYQIAIPRALGGEGGKGGGDQQPMELVTVRAVNLAEARSLLNSVVSRSINLSHVKAFVFGEAFARKGVGDVMSVAMRFREFRGTMYIGVVQNATAKEFLEKNSPHQEPLSSKYLENMFSTTDTSGYFTKSQIHDFYRRLKSNEGSPYAVLMGINPQQGGKMDQQPASGDKLGGYTAGNLPRDDKANPVEMLGTAVFSRDKMVGTLNSQETRMILMLQGKFGRGYLVVEDPLEPEKNLNLYLRLGRQPKINCWIEQGQWKISADVLLEAEISSLPSGINYEASRYSQMLEQQVDQVVEREMSRALRKTQAMGTDIVGFGAHAARHFTTYGEYAEFDFEKMYPQAEITLTVKTTIRRTGLMWQTSPIAGKKQQ
ncbi:MAG: Ger(x)C family spore germination protein [Sporomusaceae bacterium]|nr:Ger(x)C family spore germination protein [Sporomusaceae bacterium]